MTRLGHGKQVGLVLRSISESRDLLGQLARRERLLGPAHDRRHLAAAGKAGSALSSVDAMLDLAMRSRGVTQARYHLHAFDAAWIGWNACFSRGWDLPSGDLCQYLKSLKKLSPLLRSSRAMTAHRPVLSRCLRESCRKDSRATAVKALELLLDASTGTGYEKRYAEAKGRLVAASLSRSTNVQVLHALYDVRCARLHGNLWPKTLGRVAVMRGLALASTGLTVGLIHAFASSHLESPTGS